jgi:hypothetical protein
MGDDVTSEFWLVMALDWKTTYNEKREREGESKRNARDE